MKNLVNGTETSFEVKAENNAGTGPPAATKATPVSVPGSTAPVRVRPQTSGVHIEWSVPDDGGSRLLG